MKREATDRENICKPHVQPRSKHVRHTKTLQKSAVKSQPSRQKEEGTHRLPTRKESLQQQAEKTEHLAAGPCTGNSRAHSTPSQSSNSTKQQQRAGDGSVGKVHTVKWKTSHRSQRPYKSWVCTFNPRAGEAETGRSLKLSSLQVSFLPLHAKTEALISFALSIVPDAK